MNMKTAKEILDDKAKEHGKQDYKEYKYWMDGMDGELILEAMEIYAAQFKDSSPIKPLSDKWFDGQDSDQPIKINRAIEGEHIGNMLQQQFKSICKKYLLTPFCGQLDAMEEVYNLNSPNPAPSIKEFCESLNWDESPDYATTEALIAWGKIQFQAGLSNRKLQDEAVMKERIAELESSLAFMLMLSDTFSRESCKPELWVGVQEAQYILSK